MVLGKEEMLSPSLDKEKRPLWGTFIQCRLHVCVTHQRCRTQVIVTSTLKQPNQEVLNTVIAQEVLGIWSVGKIAAF